MKPMTPANWQRLDTIVTAAATLLTLAAIVGVVAGWDFGPL